MISIKDINEEILLKELWLNARYINDIKINENINLDEIKDYLDILLYNTGTMYIEIFKNKYIFTNIYDDNISPVLYNYYNGKKKIQKIIYRLRWDNFIINKKYIILNEN